MNDTSNAKNGNIKLDTLLNNIKIHYLGTDFYSKMMLQAHLSISKTDWNGKTKESLATFR